MAQQRYHPTIDIGALSYSDYIEHGDGQHGDCGDGPVDAEFVDDEICHSRGGQCSVGWTQAQDMLEYTFELSSDATVDIVLRVADNASKQLVVSIPDVAGYELLTGPGLSWHDFVDITTWDSLPLLAGTHRLRVHFVSGEMNLCSISVRDSASPSN